MTGALGEQRSQTVQGRRRWAALAFVTSLPTLSFLLADIVARRGHLLSFDALHSGGYAASLLGGWLMWGALVVGTRAQRPMARAILVGLFVGWFAIVMGMQTAFFAQWHSYLQFYLFINIKDPWLLLHGAFPIERAAPWLLGAAVWAGTIVALARRVAVVSARVARWCGATGIALAIGLPLVPASYDQPQSSPPDMLYLHGLGAGIKERLGVTALTHVWRMQRRFPEHVPALAAAPPKPRNLVIFLQESTRLDAVCVAYDAACKAPGAHTNKLLPERLPLLQMRGNATSTLITEHVLTTGADPLIERDETPLIPNIWEFAHAAGMMTAYWTSQHVMVSGARFFTQDSPIDIQVVAGHLDPNPSNATGAPEERLMDRVIADWANVREPFVAIVHLSNTHSPYRTIKGDAPFKKGIETPQGAKIPAKYLNAVHASDKQVARLVKHIRASQVGGRTIIAYTSDHGEGFGEHRTSGHTNTIYDSELRVPTWIDAPVGTLNDAERAHLVEAREQFVWHADMAATFFDLMGIWDLPEFARFKKRMPGHPLTRAERTTEPIAITNCGWTWQCKMPNFGMMQGAKKIYAHHHDKTKTYRCFDLLADPDENVELPESHCDPLPAVARERYKIMPNQMPRNVSQPW